MNISRVTKAVAEVGHDETFENAEKVRDADIDIVLPGKVSETTRQMAQTATALILRCFTGNIRVHGDASDSSLRTVLESEAKKVGGEKRLDFISQKIGPWCLALGCRRDDAVCADASGWTARINGVFAEGLPAAPPAITFAVACAVAKLFNRAIFGAEKHASEKWDYCLLRFLPGEHAPVPTQQQKALGRVCLIGAGAIGSAVGFVLRLSDWSGRLEVVDYQYFEEPNLETCISADIQSVNRPIRKALALAESFNGHPIIATERNCKVTTGSGLLDESWNALVCAVDNSETRRVLDGANAGILLNAGLGATNLDAGYVLWTRHGPSDTKLSALYGAKLEEGQGSQDQVPEEFREECSRISYQGVSLALPFAALVAGSLLAANLYQLAAGVQVGGAFVQMDLFAEQQRMTVK